ncbi:MAG: methylenetetrahydrofolate reductase [Gammaproteobacteria bacterium]|nr:methylenetetrahydrofolate reductase [Gammaproteobacteria bacterium]
MLTDKIRNRESGIIVYGITPPKQGTDPAQVADIAEKQMERLREHLVDGLILYDIQDEKTRTDDERPFPFMATLDAYEYSRDYLNQLAIPKIVYRAVGKYSADELRDFLQVPSASDFLTVFVGAASKSQDVSLSLKDAYQLRSSMSNPLLLGGVTIPERHLSKGDEHLRVIEKMKQGCSFFVSQGVYDVNASKSFLSDYYYYAQEHDIPLVPVLFTLTPCGSAKTLQFMKWLGISIPRWLENEMLHAHDILQHSVDFSAQAWRELKDFADEKQIPIGCNIESVSIRKVEIDASIELLNLVSHT